MEILDIALSVAAFAFAGLCGYILWERWNNHGFLRRKTTPPAESALSHQPREGDTYIVNVQFKVAPHPFHGTFRPDYTVWLTPGEKLLVANDQWALPMFVSRERKCFFTQEQMEPALTVKWIVRESEYPAPYQPPKVWEPTEVTERQVFEPISNLPQLAASAASRILHGTWPDLHHEEYTDGKALLDPPNNRLSIRYGGMKPPFTGEPFYTDLDPEFQGSDKPDPESKPGEE